jgi:hypothetical protein
MKHIFIFSLILFSLPMLSGFSQTANNLIDTKYEWFGGRLVYSLQGGDLSFKDLTDMMQTYPDGKSYMAIAKKHRTVGIIAVSLGTAGVIASFLGTAADFDSAIFWPSFGVLLVGSGYLSSQRANVQKAVNGYNHQLYQSKRGKTQLDFRISPLNSGLALRF